MLVFHHVFFFRENTKLMVDLLNKKVDEKENARKDMEKYIL